MLCDRTRDMWHQSLSTPCTRKPAGDRDNLMEKGLVFATDGMESVAQDTSYWEFMKRDCGNPKLLGLYILEEWYDGRVIGGDGVLVCGNVRLGTSFDESYELDIRFTVVYERAEDQWKIVHIHNSIPQIAENNGWNKIYTVVEKAEKAMAIAEELKVLARMDQMTEVYNHKTFLDIAEKVAQKTAQCPYCYIIDMDNFKQINDTYGHPEGDRILKILADILREQTRSGDLVGRIGGDEFAILCLQIPDDATAGRIARRILQEFRHRTMEYHNEELFGLSIGIARLKEGEKFSQVLRKADRALYQAKSSGKKTYCMYRQEDDE